MAQRQLFVVCLGWKLNGIQNYKIKNALKIEYSQWAKDVTDISQTIVLPELISLNSQIDNI